MAKDKYKRKKQHAQRKAQQRAESGIIMEQKKIIEDNTESAAKTTNETTNDKNPSRWQRFKNYVDKSASFTDRCIAVFTFVLAAAAIYQFIIMGGQLDVMRKDQRAWIQVTLEGSVATVANTTPSISIVLGNTGKTPATHVVGDFYIEIVPNGQDPRFEASILHTTMTSGAIFPNAPQETTVVRARPKVGGNSDEGEGDPLTENEMASLNDGKSWIAIYGRVAYQDVFHSNHWINFCSWQPPKPGIYSARKCTAYNNVDDK
jgi:hypothetical protein